MIRENVSIGHIPALLWGKPAQQLMIAVHGDQSHKADPVIALVAETAAAAGVQVLSFDLPEHGGRSDRARCEPGTCVEELGAVMRYARSLCGQVSLFGCSLGAYFSLLAYRGEPLEQCLFLSPVVDMEQLIRDMMGWAGVSEERLRAEGEIPTAFGKTLYWDYYHYVKEHPVESWNAPTAILYGEKDDISASDRVHGFARRFLCDLTVMPDGEHFFHTETQLAFFRRWLEQNLNHVGGTHP